MQVDFQMPGRLGAEYVDEDNSRKTPVMLHRAILGSMERFIGILIEHHAGAMPLWLSPIQAVVLNITDRQAEYAREVQKSLQDRGIRADLDLRNEKIGFKIREHTIQKVPYLIVVGDQDAPEVLEVADTLEWGIAGAKKRVIPDTAHHPHMEKPEEFNRIVIDFLSVW